MPTNALNVPTGSDILPSEPAAQTEMQRMIESTVTPMVRGIKAQLETVTGELNALKAVTAAEQTTSAASDTTGTDKTPKKTGLIGRTWRDLTHDNPADTLGEEKGGKKTAIGVTAVIAGLAGLGTSVASIPVIGKIPLLAKAAGWLQSTLSGLTVPLGLGTGSAATNSILESIPWTGAGPVAAATLAVPTVLWGAGMLKGFIKGEKYVGFWNNVRAGANWPVHALFTPYDLLMKARDKTGEVVSYGWENLIKTPVTGAWNLTKRITAGTWHTLSETAGAALKPTKWGVGGAAAAAVAAVASGGVGIVPYACGAAGFGILNYLKNAGHLDGSSSSPSSHG